MKVLDITLWKDVDRKAARLIITLVNIAYEGSLKDIAHVVCKEVRLDMRSLSVCGNNYEVGTCSLYLLRVPQE